MKRNLRLVPPNPAARPPIEFPDFWREYNAINSGDRSHVWKMLATEALICEMGQNTLRVIAASGARDELTMAHTRLLAAEAKLSARRVELYLAEEAKLRAVDPRRA